MDEIDALAALPDDQRRRIIAALPQEARAVIIETVKHRRDNPWLKYLGDPVRFVEEGLGETTWSKQREVMRSLVEHQRTSVPATHAPGKTHLAARLVAYWIAVHPPGTARVVTTASFFHQVKGLLWPHIRRLHRQYGLIGKTAQTTWTFEEDFLAEGVKPPDDAEAGISGYHAPHLLIIIDEAGGIGKKYGQSIEALMTGIDTRLLVLGNPPVTGDASWFEDVSNSPLFNTIRISYRDTPNFTKEKTDICRTCPKEVAEHYIAQHLVDEAWVKNLAAEFGEDSAWFQARAEARFVHDSTTKTLPMDWLHGASQVTIDAPGPIKLGVDIASDGGDEFAIAKLDGWTITLEHHSRGEQNADSMRVASVIKTHIQAAMKLHEERGISTPVRVKVDSNGVGWGVVGTLNGWVRDGILNATIVGVNVANRAHDPKKFSRSRDEMWWTFRDLIEPNRPDGGLLRLDISQRELSQLNAPTYTSDSKGAIVVESKDEMKKRKINSPDRAEAILLAVYEPVNVPVEAQTGGYRFGQGQANMWGQV